MTARLTFDNANDLIGQEIGLSDWVTVDQTMINQFAECTGDNQWIHVDVERARKQSPFGGPVAHGYLTLSLIAGMSLKLGLAPEGTVAAFNYGLDKVRFLAPVPAGARVRLRVTLMGFDAKEPGQFLMKANNVVEIDGSDKPALIAETLALIVSGRKA